jgi:hypothetical protein
LRCARHFGCFSKRSFKFELLEQNAAEHQRLLTEFQAALGRNQTAWSEQAKALAQRSLSLATSILSLTAAVCALRARDSLKDWFEKIREKRSGRNDPGRSF